MDRRAGCAGDGFDGSDGFDKGLNRRGWVAGDGSDGSDGFDRGLNQRGWVAVSCLVGEVWVLLGRRGLCLAWLARSWFCVLVGEVWVLCFGWRGSRSGFFFFFFFKYGFFFRWDFSGQWWHGGSAVVVTGQWRRCDRG